MAVISYQHETCTFCPGQDTEIEDWLVFRDLLKGDEVLESGSYTSGFTRQARSFGDIELVGITSPYAVFGGSSRTWNSEASFEHFVGLMIEDLRASGTLGRRLSRPTRSLGRPKHPASGS